MLNLSTPTDTTEKDVKDYEIPSFFGETSPKVLNHEVQSQELEHFIDTEISSTDNRITELETVDFSNSLNQIFANLGVNKAEADTENKGDTGITNTVSRMLSSYEQSNQKQGELERIVFDAQNQAKNIISQAQDEAQQIKQDARKLAYDDGYKAGFTEGSKNGHEEAYNNTQNQISKENEELLTSVRNEIESLQERRENIFKAQTAEMRDLAIAIAEKIINVSLKSSGDVIEKMVLSATEKIKNVQWAKLYVSQFDFDLKVMADVKILNAVKKITDNVKIEVMENKPSGTCILELPDQIIDASVDAQLNQVKTILSKF